MSYRVIFSRSARKEMERLSGEIETRVLARLSELEAIRVPPAARNSPTGMPGASAWATTV